MAMDNPTKNVVISGSHFKYNVWISCGRGKHLRISGTKNPGTPPRLSNPRGEPRLLSPPRAAQPSSPPYSGGNVMAASIVPPPRRRASPAQKPKWKTVSVTVLGGSGMDRRPNLRFGPRTMERRGGQKNATAGC
jgi:hypothetical protein